MMTYCAAAASRQVPKKPNYLPLAPLSIRPSGADIWGSENIDGSGGGEADGNTKEEHTVEGEGERITVYEVQCEGISSGDWEGKNDEEGRTPGEHGVIELKEGGALHFMKTGTVIFVHLVWQVAHGKFTIKVLN